MRRATSLTLALLFLATVLPANSQSADSAAPPAPGPGAGPAAGLGAEGDNITLVYELRGPLVLDCTDLVSGGAAQEYKWSVNGSALESLGAAGRARLVLDASGGRLSAADGRAQDADHGRYECAAGGTARVWAVRQRYYAKLPPYSNVVEEQPLKLACRVVGGTPAAGVAWYYSNDTELAFNRTAMKQLVVGEIVKILDGEHGLRNALLQLKTTVREDAGKYWCVPEDEAGVGEALQGLAAGTVLRVKDKYAALWPFLGICAEVFVLCAVILVYERRRTKPELDDSDTDNHDQKKS